MSLVPPKELEEALGALHSVSASARAVDTAIGTTGQRGLQDVAKLRRRAIGRMPTAFARLPLARPNGADLGSFLIRFCGAVPGEDSRRSRLHQIQGRPRLSPSTGPCRRSYSTNAHMPAGDAAGVPDRPAVRTTQSSPLGLNLPEITDIIRESFLPQKLAGPGYFRLKSKSTLEAHGGEQLCVMFFLRQTVRQELGQASEEQLSRSMHSLSMTAGVPKELSSPDCAALVRELIDASRIREASRHHCPSKISYASKPSSRTSFVSRPMQAFKPKFGTWCGRLRRSC